MPLHLDGGQGDRKARVALRHPQRLGRVSSWRWSSAPAPPSQGREHSADLHTAACRLATLPPAPQHATARATLSHGSTTMSCGPRTLNEMTQCLFHAHMRMRRHHGPQGQPDHGGDPGAAGACQRAVPRAQHRVHGGLGRSGMCFLCGSRWSTGECLHVCILGWRLGWPRCTARHFVDSVADVVQHVPPLYCRAWASRCPTTSRCAQRSRP